MKKQRKKILLVAVAMLSGIGVFAQGNGAAGITEATQMVTSYFDPATKLIYAIGACIFRTILHHHSTAKYTSSSAAKYTTFS
ncbi:DUF4134 family protein [Myroides odoratimimus]|uniref:DUF4134 family protein n=1 Tax=Myroides odoratimimus TaxID=76832 RepID=UPI003D2F9462